MTLVAVIKKTGWIAACLLAGALTLGAPVASASHPTIAPAGELGLSEAELREAETEILGAEHAAEHAQQRALAAAPEASTASGDGVQSRSVETRAAGPPAQVGQWGAPFQIPILAIHAVMLPTGKLMWWAYPNGDKSQNTAQAWLWDPATGASKRVDPPVVAATGQAANIWCSGQSLLADGRVLVTGGNLEYDPDGTDAWKGLNKVYTFNPFNETWTEQPEMPHGRWYPTQVLQPDGRTAIMSGYDETGTQAQNTSIELFTPSPNMNGVGQLSTIATRGGPGEPPGGQLYPRMFVMPSGRTMIAGPDPGDSWFFNPVGAAPANGFSWGDRADFSNARLWGTSVLEPGGPSGSSRVTMMGGTPFEGGTLRTAETFDDANPDLGWQPAPQLNVARSHHNTVLLPDGSKLTVGGGIGSRPPEGLFAFDPEQRQIELYDPASGSWRLGPSQAEGRAYHSTAVLLPDGRVISAGDDYNGGTDRDTAEIYEPPYLFRKGKRPRIKKAPKMTVWNDRFGIKTTSKKVERAVLMAPATTTHGNDMNRRHVELKVLKRIKGEGINVKAPPNANVAPPGYYMLFLINRKGEPSVARWMQLGTGSPKKTKLINDKGKKGGKDGNKGK